MLLKKYIYISVGTVYYAYTHTLAHLNLKVVFRSRSEL